MPRSQTGEKRLPLAPLEGAHPADAVVLAQGGSCQTSGLQNCETVCLCHLWSLICSLLYQQQKTSTGRVHQKGSTQAWDGDMGQT